MRTTDHHPAGRLAGGLSRVRGGAAVALMAVASAIVPALGSASVQEDEVKAAFLLNFTRFVDWPDSSFASSQDPFVICVLDDAGFAATAGEVVGDRTVGDRPVAVSERESVEAASGCHILYVPATWAARHVEVIETLEDESIFTVSDSDGFAELGGVANFKRAGSKLGLEINRKAAGRAHLKVSARLLRIADVVG